MLEYIKRSFMNIIPLTPRGYCKGVVHAIALAKKVAQQHPNTKITILGQLVHNRFVEAGLKHYGIETISDPSLSKIELLDKVTEGIVIFTAHGVSENVKAVAKAKGLTVFDATCVDVTNTQQLIDQALASGAMVFYIGKKNHPEAMAVLENSDSVNLITNETDIPKGYDHKPIFITNQTTMSPYDIEPLISAILDRYPHAQVTREICSATRKRQEVVTNLSDVDGLIVVGDPNSNNTMMLAKVARLNFQGWIQTIESIEQLDTSLLKSNENIAITAGASTPTALVNQIIHYLKAYDFNHPAPLPKVDIATVLD